MRKEDLELWLSQLSSDGYVNSYHITVKPLMATATKTNGDVITCAALIADYYREIYCR